MSYKTIKDLDVSGKRVLVRVDYNVKFRDDGSIVDDTRLRESLNTIEYIINNKGITLLSAHLGRPGGKPNKEYSTARLVKPLESLLASEKNIKVKVTKAPDCVGEKVKRIVDNAKPGDIIMLQNLRFHAEEEANDPDFAKSLADLCDIYVFDGFGVAHRAHASTVGVPLYMIENGRQVAAGILMDNELKLWEKARQQKGHKLLVIGGKKLEEKTKAVGKLYNAVDSVLVGGTVYNIVMAGKGIDVGDSLVAEKDTDYTGEGRKLGKEAKNLLLAERAVITRADDYSDYRAVRTKDGIPKGYMIADIVIDKKIKAEIAKAQVVIWFGNVGMSDEEVNGNFPFAKGTEDFKSSISPGAYVIVGGGESVAAAKGLKNLVVSTGGGASIALYTKGTLDALEALKGNINYFKK